MTVGSVTISDSGGETKSGMAEAIYDGMKAQHEAVNGSIPAGVDGVVAKRSLALMATGIAAAVTYIQANAKARIVQDTITDSNLDISPKDADLLVDIE